jgi:mannosyltransferase
VQSPFTIWEGRLSNVRVAFDNQIYRLNSRTGIFNYFEALRVNLELEGVQQTEFRMLGLAAEIIHNTFYIPFHPSIFSGLPKVVTVYDFIPEFSRGFRGRHAHLSKKSYIRRADGVLFISDTVRKQAFELGYRPEIWAVTPLGSRFHCDKVPPLSGRHNDLIYVGNRKGYKNFKLIPEAMARMSTSPKLTIVGGGMLTRSERDQLHALKISYEHFEFASDEQLEQLYLGSKLCVVPSMQEGFGLPIVEAMSLGCPVVTLDTEIAREVGGDAAVLIAHSNPDEWAEAICNLLVDAAVWTERSDLGVLRSKIFDWRNTAALTANLYERVLAARGN